MRMLRLFAMAALLTAPAGAHPIFLGGQIGGAPVFAAIARDGAKLLGWYFYLKVGKELRLEGVADAKGRFKLVETDFNSGKQTGSFDGAIAGAHWSGTWHNPVGASPLAFALDDSRDTLTALDGRFRCTTKWTDRQFGYTYTHTVDLAVARGRVKGLSLVRGETSSAGDDQSCQIGLADLDQQTSDAGILLRAKGAAAPRCSIRILGAGDYLVIRMGDAGEDGNDCRGGEDAMFCSPRSFWADLIVDRKTAACKSVE